MDGRRSDDDLEAVVATTGNDKTSERRIDVGVLVVSSPETDPERLCSFAARMAADAADGLGAVTDIDWWFHAEEPGRLSDEDVRRPSEFLDRAIDRKVEGPYDVIVVVTDVPVISSRKQFVPGVASPLGRVVVISTRILLRTPRGETRPSLDSPMARRNGATLLLHLIGHILGARHRDADGGIMEPFRFDTTRREIPSFDTAIGRYVRRIAGEVPEEDTTSRNPLRRIAFYGASVARNPGQVLQALVHSRAPLLPLSLPKLSTAAVTPTLVIVFSAEAWDVGFNMTNATATLFAASSIVAATAYLLFAQNLSFPSSRHRTITEHAALVNVAVSLILLLAMVGLFVLVGAIILVIELVVFPPDLMSNWPSLEDPAVGHADLVRTAAFISSIGVLSGALAGGLESRTIVRHLILFLDDP